MAEERPGFLGRWARRKTDALQGRPLDEPAAPTKTAALPAVAGLPAALDTKPAEASAPATPSAEQPEKLLSLDDVKALTQDSDFKPFMARNVGSDVRNAAMKKLFTDPHYNVMDGLDIYIDDYSRSDPIPESMLRQMASAQFLNLFADEEKDGKDSDARPVDEAAGLSTHQPENPLPETAASSCDPPDARSPHNASPESHSSQPEPLESSGASQQGDHAHPHLRLQPDHAPSAPHAGRGAS